MRWLRAWLGVRYFNIHAEGKVTDDDTWVADVTNLPEKSLNEVIEVLLEWGDDVKLTIEVAP